MKFQISKKMVSNMFKTLDYPVFLFLMIFKLHYVSRITNTEFQNILWVSIATVLLASFWTLLFSFKKRLVILFVLNTLLSFIFVSDIIYYRYFSDFITVTILSQAGQAGAITDSIANLFVKKDFMLVMDILLSIPLIIYVFRKVKKNNGKKKYDFLLKTSISIAILATGISIYNSEINKYTSKYGTNLFINNWSNISVYKVTGLLGFHANDIKNYLNENYFDKKVITEEELRSVEDWFEEKKNSNSNAASELFGSAKGKNVIVIQTEAFENALINRKVNGEEITPNLNKFINQSAYFKNFWHMVGQGRTSDAEFLANSSLHPLPVGSVYKRFTNSTFDSLPSILKNNGYSTFAAHAFEASYWNRNAMYMNNYKMDAFFSQNDFEMIEKAGPFGALGDEQLFLQSIDKVKETANPFYLFMVTLSSHHPYYGFKELMDLGEYKNTDIGKYINSARYVDNAFGTLFEKLKEENLWDDTIIVIYGDHDSALLKSDDESTKKFLGEDYKDFGFNRNQVPLFIRIPDDKIKGEYETPGGQIDVTPTVLDLLGIASSDKYHMGESLFNSSTNFVAMRDGSGTDGEYFFRAPVDAQFEGGTCYNYADKTKTELANCSAVYKEIRNRLNISDLVITQNLIPKLRSN